jgi:hypothetical protein
MTIDDIRDFTRCMRRTTASDDAEVLEAVREANRILDRYSCTWASFWWDVEAAIRHRLQTTMPTVDDAFEELLATLRPGSYREFIAGMREQWETRRRLSDRQRELLDDALHDANIRLWPRFIDWER